MYPIDGMIASHRRSLRQPGTAQRQRVLPGHAGRAERSAVEQDRRVLAPPSARSAALAATIVSDSATRGSARSCRRSSANVNRSPCRGAGRGRVGQVEHVAEPERVARGVVLEQVALRVQPRGRVGDTPLHRLRHGPAVARRPVGEQLTRLVGTLQHVGDDPAVLAGAVHQAGGQAGPDVFGGADQRRGAQVRATAQPAQEPRGPLRVRDGGGADQLAVALVAVAGRLVERLLADHVGHRQQEQLRHQVPRIARPTLVGDPVGASVRLGLVFWLNFAILDSPSPGLPEDTKMPRRGDPRSSRRRHKVLWPLSYAPMSRDGRSRTCDLSINSRSIRRLRTGPPRRDILCREP